MTELERLYRKYFNDVYLYMLRLSGNEHIAEEITGDTFLKAMRSIKDFRGDCDIRVWLCQIAKNNYYTYIKKHKKNIGIEDDKVQDLLYTEITLQEKIEEKDSLKRIQKILHTIPEPYKEVFMRRVFAELSFKQIGTIWNKNEN